MTPGARVQSAIGLLSEILPDDGPAADAAARGWFRKRRYAGSKDRAAVTGLVYQVLRQREELAWALSFALAPATGALTQANARTLTLAALARLEGLSPGAIAQRFDGSQYGPEPLSVEEQAVASHLADRASLADAPDWVRGNYPQALDGPLRAGLGENVVAEMAAIIPRAPTDLRVNTLKTDRGAAQASLDADGIAADLTPLSPIGLRVKDRARIAESAAFRSGLVEVQDEGAQLASLLVAPDPGHTVVDYCAGAGGKALGLAAAMGNAGTLHAFDTNAGRLGKSKPRFSRSGVKCVVAQTITGGDDPAVVALHGKADRVLVDAPCTGSGTWRRAPEGKWRVTEKTINENAARQRAILGAAAPLVRPGGRLVYVTCSVFREENHAQADSFLETRSDFRAMNVGDIWGGVLPGPAPGGGPYLQLTPLRNHTDGFFVAVFERAAQ
jgi:16S rRNA (cytosine967-C5)-methyltransferase